MRSAIEVTKLRIFLIAASALLVGMAPARAGLDVEETRIRETVAAQQGEALAFLERVVNISSGTMNHEGVRAVGAEFADAFEAIGFETEWESFPEGVNRAGHLLARREGDTGRKLLLIGHLDTVFDDAGGAGAFRIEAGTAFGPGVADMKGGNVVALYALKALAENGFLDDAQIEIVFTGDEEFTGKPLSLTRKSLVEAARRADVALNFEGGEEGVAVTARRGSSGWRLTTAGKRRHSSGIFSEEVGAGAVFEAARILNAFYDELSEEKYLTFNPGVILGGTDVEYDSDRNQGSALGKTNVVAQKVVVDGGLRFISEAQKERARDRMRKIVERHLPQTDAEIEFIDSYPAMPPTPANARLLEIFSAVSEELGYGPVIANDPAERGAADISFAAPHAKASMDGLGPRGDGAHTLTESVEIGSLREATERAAILIYRLTREDAPEL